MNHPVAWLYLAAVALTVYALLRPVVDYVTQVAEVLG